MNFENSTLAEQYEFLYNSKPADLNTIDYANWLYKEYSEKIKNDICKLKQQ